MRGGVSPFGKITPGQATAFCRSRKTRQDEQRRFAVRRNHAGGSNGVLPFGENAFGQETAFRRSRKMRRDGQRRFAVSGKCVRASNGISPFEENAPGRQKLFWVELAFALGKQHPFGFSEKSRRVEENLFGCCPLSRWGTKTARGSALSESNLEIDGYEIIAVLLINVSPIAFLGFHFAVVFHGNLSQLGIRQFLAF